MNIYEAMFNSLLVDQPMSAMVMKAINELSHGDVMDAIREAELLRFEAAAELVLEMNDRYETIFKLFHESHEEMAKHIVASSVHLSTFMVNVSNEIAGNKVEDDILLLNEFTDHCGCKTNKLI